MKLRLLLISLLLFSSLNVNATHLTGGDFELQHKQDYSYRLILNLYFDEINGLPGARDSRITVKVFEKGTDTEITIITMPLRIQQRLNYSNIACTTGELRTSKIIYYQDIVLDPTMYNHPEGYYVVWERCCRNGTINNIVDPGDVGQTFYMEFPAVIKNGQAFQNSSPVLSAPISDYACINQAFSYDFAATDPDGDRVEYELVTPLKGNSSPDAPVISPLPEPYDPISWLPGYDQNNQIRGNPALAIDKNTGRLTVTPSFQGLFVFSVRYQEFRNGVKIGEVRRDFQLLVKACPVNNSPVITAKGSNSAGLYKEGEILRISSTGSRCFTLFLTDPDKNERLTLTAEPVNFTKEGFSLSGQTTGSINAGDVQETLTASICFEECFNSEGAVYMVDMIVSDFGDNGCGVPKRDTVRVSFMVEPVPDLPPLLSFSTPKRELSLYDGENLAFNVTGSDPDNNPLTVSVKGLGFDISTQNIQFDETSGDGQITVPFSWKIDCNANEAPTYEIEFTVTSVSCGQEVSRSEVVKINILKRALTNNTVSAAQAICYGQTPNTLTGSLPTGGNDIYRYRWEVSTTDDQANFTVASGNNSEQSYEPPALFQTTWFRRVVISGSCDELEHISDPVKIMVNPLPDLPIVKDASVCPEGIASLSASSPAGGITFEWFDQDTGGNLLHTGATYQTMPLVKNTTYFVQATNSNGCISASRAVVTVEVLQPTADAGVDTTIILGRNVVLRAKGGLTYQWSPATGLSNPSIPNPIANPQKTTTYTLTVTSASGCIYTDEITVTVLPRIRVADAITFNGDGINDTWYIENIEFYPQCNIKIFTRWGAKVFESDGYKEPWDGTDRGKELPMAAYYYIIKLNDKEKPIAGSLTLIK